MFPSTRPRAAALRLAFPAAVVAAAALSALSSGRTARAAVQESDASSAAQATYDPNILAGDLINNGNAALSGSPVTTGSIAAYQGDIAPYNNWSNLTDGQASSKGSDGKNNISHDTYFDGTAMNTGPSITYTFNAAANPNGFTLTQINSVSGWADTTSFSNQKWSVFVAPVNSPGNFTQLATVNFAPFTGNAGTPNSSQVTLTDTTGALANNVGQVRFTIANNGGSGQVFREIDVVGQPSTTAPPPPPPPVPTLLPLGDSITYGDQASPGPIPGGYRTKLYTDLHNAGYNFNYVGSQTGNPSPTLSAAGQINNEGHNGYRIDQITNNLDASDGTSGNNGGFWLAGAGGTGRPAVNPGAILLHIGTNDILQHYDPSVSGTSPEATFLADLETRLNALVSKLLADRPAANLFIASIIPIPSHTNANGVDENTEVKAYNTYIQNVLVPQYQLLGNHVYYVDQYDNFINPDGSIKTALIPDNIHPNQAGYDLMGDTWAAAVQAVPEPGAVGLFVLAGIPLLARRRRRSPFVAQASRL